MEEDLVSAMEKEPGYRNRHCNINTSIIITSSYVQYHACAFLFCLT